MRPFILSLMVCFLLVQGAQAQTTSGHINITLLDARNQPVPGQRIGFTDERKTMEAACTTGETGICTLVLAAVPPDGSGFIRGILTVSKRGRRPVIWPGGTLALTLTLTAEGTVETPIDIHTMDAFGSSSMPSLPRELRRSSTPAPSVTEAPLPESTPSPTEPQPSPGLPRNQLGSIFLFCVLFITLMAGAVYAAWRKEGES